MQGCGLANGSRVACGVVADDLVACSRVAGSPVGSSAQRIDDIPPRA